LGNEWFGVGVVGVCGVGGGGVVWERSGSWSVGDGGVVCVAVGEHDCGVRGRHFAVVKLDVWFVLVVCLWEIKEVMVVL